MRIAFDARTLFHGGTGERTYLRELVRAIAAVSPQDICTLYEDQPESDRHALAAEFPNVQTACIDFSIGWLWNSLALPPRLRQDKMDVLQSQYTLPLRAPCPTVVTIHDITFRLFPEWFPRRACQIMNILIPLAARTSTRIITGSQCAKDDMVHHFKIRPEKIVVTPYAVAPEFCALDPDVARLHLEQHYPQLESPYILGVGLRGVRKNIVIVLRAIAELQRTGQWPEEIRVALTGTQEQFRYPEVEQLRDTIVFLGYVSDTDLPALYAAAIACVYPSLYEGFGLPALEALACGCPLLCSDTSSLPEVVGDAGLLLPPQDLDAWKEALLNIVENKTMRDEFRQKGIARARQFSWEQTAYQTLDVYREVSGH